MLVMFFLISSICINASNRFDLKVENLARPYKKAGDFVFNYNISEVIDGESISVLYGFSQYNFKKLDQSLQQATKLIRSRRLMPYQVSNLKILINKLEKIKSFIIDYEGLITYYEIASTYHEIDMNDDNIVDYLLQKSLQLGLPSMKGRGLYKFVKRIDLDQRRLCALLEYGTTNHDVVIKIQELQQKIQKLRIKIICSSQYATQIGKTRFLKAFGILLFPFVWGCYCAIQFMYIYNQIQIATSFVGLLLLIILLPVLIIYYLMIASVGFLISVPVIIIPTIVATTIHDCKQAAQYNIPKERSSVFSLAL